MQNCKKTVDPRWQIWKDCLGKQTISCYCPFQWHKSVVVKNMMPPWENSDISGCRNWKHPPMVSLELPWKDASIDILHTLIRGLWAPEAAKTPCEVWPKQRLLQPQKSDIISLEPPWYDSFIDTQHALIRGPWGHQNYFSHTYWAP